MIPSSVQTIVSWALTKLTLMDLQAKSAFFYIFPVLKLIVKPRQKQERHLLHELGWREE